MWYVISAGVGLLIGIGFAIWALIERSKRAAAELRTTVEVAAKNAALASAAASVQVATAAVDNAAKIKAQVQVLRAALTEARDRLIKCQDPQAIKAWLDSELKAEDV